MSTYDFYNIEKLPITVAGQQWTLNLYQGFKDVIYDQTLNQDLKAVINYVIKRDYTKPFRYNLEAHGIQFLCGIMSDKKEVYIASKQLSLELTLAKSTTGDSILDGLHDHAEMIATIPLENTPSQIELITFEHDLVDFEDDEFNEAHEKANELTQKLVKKVGTYKQSLFEKVSDFGLDLTANYMLVRIHLLKFLAILPCLDHDKDGNEVKRILIEAITRLIDDSNIAKEKMLKGQQRPLPDQYIFILKMVRSPIKLIPAKPLAKIIRSSVSFMAKRFIAGTNIKSAKKSLTSLINSGRDATLDQLGELVVSNKEADQYVDQVIEVIEGFSRFIKPGARNKAGINKAHVSIKVSALSHDFRPYAFEQTYEKVAPRLKKILLTAKKHQAFINIDAEHYHFRDVVLKIYGKVLLETPELHDYKDTGIVVQAYLRDGHKHFMDVVELAEKRNICMPIRLVKGAYWDVETVEADALNFDAPEFLNKEETDIHFRQLVCMSFENSKHIQLAVASHNIQDHCFAEAVRSKKYPDAPIIEHQCLHMTYEALSVGLSKMGWPTRNYIPIGNLLVGMAYLVRRIMENSSQVGVLTMMRSHKKAMEIRNPKEVLAEKFDKNEVVYDESVATFTREFKNIYPLRSYLEKHFHPIYEKLHKMKDEFSNGKLLYDDGEQVCVSSSDPNLVLAKIDYDTPEQVNQKIEKLFTGFDTTDWKRRHQERYTKLLMLADKLLINREYLTSLIMLEAGKTLDESIADVDEAIDFIHFYVKEHDRILTDEDTYKAKGVFGIIAPWNFPLAIPVGMTTAALATGNTALLKPAEQTPLIVRKFVELARECHIGEDILALSLGEGDVGKAIVDHELVNGVVFTGSKAVGTQIYQKLTSQLTPERYGHDPIGKTVITEMGGKNAIIITNNCELDETVAGVIYSAFAHSGQKCSACSRLIIDEKIKDAFVERFVAAVKDLTVGESYALDTVINPLITKEDQDRVKDAVKKSVEEVKKHGGKVHADLSQENFPGFCVGPAVFEVSSEQGFNKESFAQQEIFGPVVHIIPYKNLDHAVELYNSTDYALTGGIFCQSQDDIDYLMPKLESGNIYINRPNTGARVAIEPFGGFKMSGTGPKAGSVDYLYSFLRQPVDVEDVKEDDVDENIDESLDFIPARNSGLNWNFRREKILILLDEVIANYEVYFQRIEEDEKNILIDLKEFIANPLNDLETKEYPNRRIPGQISYTMRDQVCGAGAMVFSNEKITLSSFVEVAINLYLGNGINIFCTHQSTYDRWTEILHLCYRVGFSVYNVSCLAVNQKRLIDNLNTHHYQFVIFDYHSNFYKAVTKELFKEPRDWLLKTYISDVDLKLGQWERFIDAFTNARSFAINTMRHGAPLEVDLNESSTRLSTHN